jgi:serine/threonine protein kinase/tetratricopeptide (TPR) repeat protein
MDSLVGQTVSHYRVTRQLGAGGMGIVYEAEDTRLGRRVAVKFLSEQLQKDAPMLERFQREARAASSLNHPGICTVHSIEQHEGHQFIVMELLEGETLAERMKRERIGLDTLLDMGIQIADALESAHAKGIVHRDLKPVNLFVTPGGRMKVLDFGLAKIERLSPVSDKTVATGDPRGLQGGDLTVAGTVLGTVHYMSPEQARGQLTDARTDLFSLGALLYQMASGEMPFPGDTQAVVFDAILNRDPRSLTEIDPSLPAELGQILDKTLEKDRSLRCQSATELKTDLLRLRRKLDARRALVESISDSKPPQGRPATRSIAVLYFENLSGVKDDEYFRDGITEDILTDLSKIKGLNVFPRTTVLAFRDVQTTAAQVCQQLRADYALEGSLRRAGNRLRINAQLIDAATGFPVWSERYDREMSDVFALQDEIAHKIAEALRITLTPQEQAELALKPTDNLQAYDLYLRGRSYARRRTRQDMEFALQMFENAVLLDPNFALAYAAIANGCAHAHYWSGAEPVWLERAQSASLKAVALSPDNPEVLISQAWILHSRGANEDAERIARAAISRKADCEGAYHLLLRALFSAGNYQKVVEIAEVALEASGTDYNVYVPILNSMNALGKSEAARNVRLRLIEALNSHLRGVPEDARARILLATTYAEEGREEDSVRETNLAMVLRPNEPTVLYNAACTFCFLNRKREALDALTKAWHAGYKDARWTRRDPDLTILHGEPEFERLYPDPDA